LTALQRKKEARFSGKKLKPVTGISRQEAMGAGAISFCSSRSKAELSGEPQKGDIRNSAG